MRIDDVFARAFQTLANRGAEYDRASGLEDNFGEIAGLASMLLGRPVSKWDVAMTLVAVKLRRIASAPAKDDSYLDLINYAAFAALFAPEGPDAHHDVRVSQADRRPDGEDGGTQEGG